MSNIGKTSASIKKKLSLGDYSKSADKHDSKKMEQHASDPVHQQVGESIDCHTDKKAKQPESIPARQHIKGAKTKATYYLGKQEIEMITHLYIKQLKQYHKADKSAIICEAIRLIYERDK
ncbi:MAG TPA: hypothetical protein VGW78_03135 [Candidatus Babeliales bacterium]|jgi:hypothetical protein|nr:hypothetical protein [Candidatus Babeliales bacterium]